MKMLSGKKGFTLVEMLIVITIVGLLATISIGGYTRFRKVSVLDLAAKALVANVYDARDSAKFGRVVGGAINEGADNNEVDGSSTEALASTGGSSMCFGVKFSPVDGVTKVVSKFDNRKEWNGVRWVYKGCKDQDDSIPGTLVNLGEGIKVESINVGSIHGEAGETGDSGDSESCTVMFAPPDGRLEGDGCVIVIGYGDNDTDAQRKITIDSATGKAEINKITDEIEAQ